MSLGKLLMSSLLCAVTACGVDAPMDEVTVTENELDAQLVIGANIHHGGRNPTANQEVADVLAARNLKRVRMDFNYDDDPAMFRDQVQRLAARGIKAEVGLFPANHWDTRCTLDLAVTEQTAYEQTAHMVDAIKDLVHELELMNEVTLSPQLKAEVPFNSSPTLATYADKPCYRVKLAALRGMYRAIRDLRAQSGLPLRVIVGAVGRDYGYLDLVRQNGIDFDILGYHIYPWEQHAPLDQDPWYGTGGPLGQLARFNRPVHINEFNCGEIYDAAYENQVGKPKTEACLRSVKKHLFELFNQRSVRLESVNFYELLDEPSKAAPENHFGMMTSLTSPKLHLALASAFAGGSLTPAEESAITSRGLLTTAEILAFRNRVAPPAPGVDLVVTGISFAPNPPSAGNAVVLSATIKNRGSVASPATIHGVAFAVDGVVTVWSDTYKTSLAPGQSVTVKANFGPAKVGTWTPRNAKTYTVKAVVDDVNRMAESNERNNAASIQVTVQPTSFASISNEAWVTALYRVMLGREPDANGLAAYVRSLDGGNTKLAVEQSVYGSPEFQTWRSGRGNYAPAPSLNALSNEDFLSLTFIVLLRRDVDDGARAGYGARLDAGEARANIVREVLGSQEFKANIP